MLKGHLHRVIYHRVYQYTKITLFGRSCRTCPPQMVSAPDAQGAVPFWSQAESVRWRRINISAWFEIEGFITLMIDSGLGGYHECRRCSRDTYPKS